MMKFINVNTKSTIHIILAGAMIMTLTGGFTPGDVDYSGRTDLKDAILIVRSFSDDAPTAFKKHVERMVSAFQVLAGLETALEQDDGEAAQSSSKLVFLPNVAANFKPHGNITSLNMVRNSYTSIISAPDAPPPKAV